MEEHFLWKKRPKVLNRQTKWQRRQREKLPVKTLHSAICHQKKFPPLAGEMFTLLKDIKIWNLSQFASHSKVVDSEDHFSEEGLFKSRFSKSSFKFKRKWKVRVPSNASVSKYYSGKTYANLWFILLQVTKGFRFQKNKNVRFISGNFSSDRFLWKVKTIRYGLHILINKHLQYRCLEFTILKRMWRIFAKKL